MQEQLQRCAAMLLELQRQVSSAGVPRTGKVQHCDVGGQGGDALGFVEDVAELRRDVAVLEDRLCAVLRPRDRRSRRLVAGTCAQHACM